MSVTKEMLDAVCQNLETIEEAKKDAAAEFKDTVEAFASSHDMDVKSVKKFFKEWKEYQKNREEYIQVDYESDNLLQIACPEIAPAA